MGKLKELELIGHDDAGVKSHPDKTTSGGGHVIVLCNTKICAMCVLNWKSRKIRRVVDGSLAGGVLTTADTIGELVYKKAVPGFIFGDKLSAIIVIVMMDSQDLYMAVQGSGLVEDAWTIPDVACIKEAVKNGNINALVKVKGSDVLANCLMKKDLLHEAIS